MADIRIKDLATTASTTASDDFMAVDGTTNGTRKLSAATPSFATSVTVPGVAGPTATDLTLAGGSTGASLVLGQGANNNITLTPSGSGFVIARSLLSSQRDLVPSSSLVGQVAAVGLTNTNKATVMGYDTTNNFGFIYAGIVGSNYSPIVLQPMAASGNVLIGGTTDIIGSGGLKVFGTTAASSTASGALQVAGGVGVAGAGYFGGDVFINKTTPVFRLQEAGSTQMALIHSSGNGFFDYTGNLTFRTPGAGPSAVATLSSTGILNLPNTTSASSSIAGALTIGNGTAATNVAIGGGAINAGASVETVGYFRAASGTAISAATGRGVEIGYLTSADAGYITSYDRTGVAWKPLNLQASSFGLLSSGTSSFTVSSSGIANFTNSTASTGVGTGALQVAGGIYAGAASVFAGQLTAKGTATNDSAATGYIGEFVSASLAAGSAVTLANNTTANITSVSLTAGDWDVEANAILDLTGATVTTKAVGISATSATLGSFESYSYQRATYTTITGADGAISPTYRISIASTTTVYAVTQVGFSAGTVKIYGSIRARRVR